MGETSNTETTISPEVPLDQTQTTKVEDGYNSDDLVEVQSNGAVLGIGSYGRVVVEYSDKYQRPLACKTIDFGNGKNTLEKAERECMILKSLRHDNIVKYHDTHIEGNGNQKFACLKLYMELCENGSLRDLIGRKKDQTSHRYLSEVYIWRVFIQIAAALKYCHFGLQPNSDSYNTKGWEPVLHRDIKPGNILLRSGCKAALDVIKLADFGISVMLQEGSEPGTDFIGTAVYLAPEINSAKGKIRWTEACDIHSLGVTMYELCTYEWPFSWQREYESQKCPPIPGRYSRALQSCIQKCMAFSPADRPNAKELYRMVEQGLTDNEVNQEPDTTTDTSNSAEIATQPYISKLNALTVPDVEAEVVPKQQPSSGKVNFAKKELLQKEGFPLALLSSVPVAMSIGSLPNIADLANDKDVEETSFLNKNTRKPIQATKSTTARPEGSIAAPDKVSLVKPNSPGPKTLLAPHPKNKLKKSTTTVERPPPGQKQQSLNSKAHLTQVFEGKVKASKTEAQKPLPEPQQLKSTKYNSITGSHERSAIVAAALPLISLTNPVTTRSNTQPRVVSRVSSPASSSLTPAQDTVPSKPRNEVSSIHNVPTTNQKSKKALMRHSVYNITKVPVPDGNQSWMNVLIKKCNASQQEIRDLINKLNSVEHVAEAMTKLSPNQHAQVTQLVDDVGRNEPNSNFEWTLTQLHRKVVHIMPGVRQTSEIMVFLRRVPQRYFIEQMVQTLHTHKPGLMASNDRERVGRGTANSPVRHKRRDIGPCVTIEDIQSSSDSLSHDDFSSGFDGNPDALASDFLRHWPSDRVEYNRPNFRVEAPGLLSITPPKSPTRPMTMAIQPCQASPAPRSPLYPLPMSTDIQLREIELSAQRRRLQSRSSEFAGGLRISRPSVMTLEELGERVRRQDLEERQQRRDRDERPSVSLRWDFEDRQRVILEDRVHSKRSKHASFQARSQAEYLMLRRQADYTRRRLDNLLMKISMQKRYIPKNESMRGRQREPYNNAASLDRLQDAHRNDCIEADSLKDELSHIRVNLERLDHTRREADMRYEQDMLHYENMNRDLRKNNVDRNLRRSQSLEVNFY